MRARVRRALRAAPHPARLSRGPRMFASRARTRQPIPRAIPPPPPPAPRPPPGGPTAMPKRLPRRWASLGDERLLHLRLKDLDAEGAGSALRPRVHRVLGELEQRGRNERARA